MRKLSFVLMLCLAPTAFAQNQTLEEMWHSLPEFDQVSIDVCIEQYRQLLTSLSEGPAGHPAVQDVIDASADTRWSHLVLLAVMANEEQKAAELDIATSYAHLYRLRVYETCFALMEARN